MKSYDNKYPLDYYNELEKNEIEIYNEMYFDEKEIPTINNIAKKYYQEKLLILKISTIIYHKIYL